jgi:hypothetical protein
VDAGKGRKWRYVVNCKYELINDDELKIEKLPGAVKDEAVTQYFRKRIINGGN